MFDENRPIDRNLPQIPIGITNDKDSLAENRQLFHITEQNLAAEACEGDYVAVGGDKLIDDLVAK